jgi:hypothetical protein
VDILTHILTRYLYKEDVQEIARSLGIPTSGSKDEIVDQIVSRSWFKPEEALEFLNAHELRELCRELRLSTAGHRDELFERVLEAIYDEWPQRFRRPKIDVSSVVRSAPDKSGESPTNSPRQHPDSTGPWAIAGILATVVLGITLYALAALFGVWWGSLLTAVLTLVVVISLLASSHLWIPAIAARIRIKQG